MTRFTVEELEHKAKEAIDLVQTKGERIVLSKSGHDVAAIISAEDLARYEQYLLEEDRIDLEEAQKALEEPGPNVPLEEVRRRLGI